MCFFLVGELLALPSCGDSLKTFEKVLKLILVGYEKIRLLNPKWPVFVAD